MALIYLYQEPAAVAWARMQVVAARLALMVLL
jgi:hypothetical protein